MKQATLEGMKKECQETRQKIATKETEKQNYTEKVTLEIEMMEDLVSTAKATIEKTDSKI